MTYRMAFAAALALTLGGCGSSDQPSSGAPDQPASGAPDQPAAGAPEAPNVADGAPAASAPAAASGAAPATGEKPAREFVAGKWGTDSNCETLMNLRADGTTGGPFGDWFYDDGVIGFENDPELKLSVTVIDENTMESKNISTGNTWKLTRCP